MHLTQKPASAESLQIDNGIRAFRAVLEGSGAMTLDVSSTELLWMISRKGALEVRTPQQDDWNRMGTGNSAVFFYTREPWQLQVKSITRCQTMGFGISLTALHDLLAVEYDATKSKENTSMDYSKLLQVIALSPRHLQEIDRIFVQSNETRFGSIARRGAFLSAFATLLDTLFGNPMAQCPFHIDLETEQRIRKAQELLVSDLHDMRDVSQLALEANLPKTVLRQGFEYLYGKAPAQYYQDYKFEKSVAMLESGKYLIRDIAFAVGFQNPSHFISAFKQRFHTTPKQWIKQREKGDMSELA